MSKTNLIRMSFILAVAPIHSHAAVILKSAPITFQSAYLGFDLGTAWESTSVKYNDFHDDLSSNQITFGVLAGYNWQSDRIVLGSEADFQSMDLDSSSEKIASGPYSLSERAQMVYLATLRGRLGYTVQPSLLLFATGGAAWITNFNADASYNDDFGWSSESKTLTGWALGGGGEWKITQRCSAKLEYVHVDFQSMDVSADQILQVNFSPSAELLRFGLNYHFS